MISFDFSAKPFVSKFESPNTNLELICQCALYMGAYGSSVMVAIVVVLLLPIHVGGKTTNDSKMSECNLQ